MGFDFALSPLLWLRQVIEEREERLLLRIVKEIAALAESTDQLDAELAAADAARQAELARPSNGAQLRALYAYLEELRQKRRELEQKFKQLEELREKQMRIYQTARRDRQMLDEMRDQERATYENLAARREQNAVDDSFGALRARRDSLT